MGTHMEAVDEILQLGWGDASSNNHKKKRITWTPLDRARDRGLDEVNNFVFFHHLFYMCTAVRRLILWNMNLLDWRCIA